VERALRESEIFLIILTPASTASANVKDEIGYAIDHGKRILPILMEECEVPLRLRRFQYVDFTKMGFNEGAKRVEQLLETFIHERSTPLAEINPKPETRKVLVKEAAQSPLSPIQDKSFRRKLIVSGVGIVALAACLGALGMLFVSKGFIFPFATDRPSQIEKATSTHTNLPPTRTRTPTPPVTPASTIPTARPGEQRILVADGGRLLLIESPSGEIVWQKDGFNALTCVTTMANGHILICDRDRVLEIDVGGTVVNTVAGISVMGVQPLGNNKILVSGGSSGSVMEMDWLGNITWSISGLHHPFESIRLANGNTLVVDGTATLHEYYPDGTLASSARLSNWASAVQRLSNGQTLVGEIDGVELLDETGQVIWTKKGLERVESVQQLPSGDFLLVESGQNRILILSQTGDIVWMSTGLNDPWDAKLLP
jgi:hypothetical protein